MRRAGSIDGFVADPIGRYYLGASYVVWCASPTLCGTTRWGRPSERDVRELTRLYESARHLKGFDVFIDDQAVEHIEWRALSVLSDYLGSRLAQWPIRRQAVVTPPGIVGLILAGIVPSLGPTFPVRHSSSRGTALAWLERDDLTLIVDEVDRIAGEARGVPPLLRGLRAYLERHLVTASVAEAARSLQISARSLQRELRRMSTSYSTELTRSRLRSACLLLLHSDEKVAFIAHQVGCLTASRLGALFRRDLGETPIGYRARHRLQARESGENRHE